jgi:hypothetical protein
MLNVIITKVPPPPLSVIGDIDRFWISSYQNVLIIF